MAKYIVTVGLELKRYIADWPSELDRVAEKWKQILKGLNDTIIERIRIRLGDGKSILPEQYINELAVPATEGWKQFVGIDKGNTNPSAVLGAFKHEIRVKGGVFKYIENTEAAFQIDSKTGRSYFMDRVENVGDKIKRTFAALQVVGARYLEKTFVPGLIMALTGDGRYLYLIKQKIASGYNVAGYKLLPKGTTWDDIAGVVPAFEPHSAHYLRPYLISAVVQRFHLAVAVDNLMETGVITEEEFKNYLKQVNTPFANISTKKASGINDVAIAYVDPLDSNLKPVDEWSDRKNKAALAFCIATGTDTCTELADYLPS